VYWGSSNIGSHIPVDRFVDKRKFNSYELLYEYIVNLSELDYMGYLENIEHFLNSSRADKFRAEHFANTIVNEILLSMGINEKGYS
jgi:hypothetical protein